MKKLERALLKAQDAYYNGTPIYSDTKYDRLCEFLRKHKPDSPVLKNVGAPPPKGSPLQKVKHQIPMGSQNKVNSVEEFIAWAKKTKQEKFVAQEKIDGASVEFIYKSGKLIQAVTRGDGIFGEDVTHTVSRIPGVVNLKSPWTGTLRGEVVCHKQKFNKYLKEQGYSNPRNAAAGLLRRKSPKYVEHLTVYFFDALWEYHAYGTETQKLSAIIELGLKTAPFIYQDVKTISKWFDGYQQNRENLPYEIDGIVVKVNQVRIQAELGEQNGRPKGQTAWKFSADAQETVLERIEWDIGLGGRITPVAVVRPVEVSGVTVRRASLHNVENVRKLGAYVGAAILVSRHGETIPQVDQVVNPKDVDIIYPENCPVCQEATVFRGEFLVCTNRDCPAKVKGNLLKWIKILGIDLAGDKFVDAVVDAGLVRDPADLYKLKASELARLERFGAISAKKVLANINSKRELDLAEFLAGLNISNVSLATFESIVSAGYDTLDKVQNITREQLLAVSGIGETTAKAVVKGLARKKKTISGLIIHGVVIKDRPNGKLTGQSFCFTGQISLARPDAQKLVKSLGGEVKSSVSKGLTYLVQADPSSKTTKAVKAKQYGTKVIGEEEFLKLVDFSPTKFLRGRK